jgi:hypothetical protein
MSTEMVAGCWIDVYELTQFGGRRRRLFGPANHQSLRSSDDRWGIPINSIVAGPNAHVRIYASGDSKGVWHLSPGQSLDDLTSFGVDSTIDSLTISDHDLRTSPGEAPHLPGAQGKTHG